MKVLLGFDCRNSYVNLGGFVLNDIVNEFFPENVFMGFSKVDYHHCKIKARLWSGVGVEFGFKFLDDRQTCKVEG